MARWATEGKHKRSKKSHPTVRSKVGIRKRGKAKKSSSSFRTKGQDKRRKSSEGKAITVKPHAVRFIQDTFKKVENILSKDNFGGNCTQSFSCPCLRIFNNVAYYSDEHPTGHDSTKQICTTDSSEISNNDMDVVPYGSAGYFTLRNASEDGQDRSLPSKVLRNTMDGIEIGAAPISALLFPSVGKTKRRDDVASDASCRLMPHVAAKAAKAARAETEDQDSGSESNNSDIESQCSQSDDQQCYEHVGSDAPLPSVGRKPTFIVMVKTAIRDLRPFRMTTRNAISRYIHLRYKVRNDRLLDYVLDWLVAMKIFRSRVGHYMFTKNRFVKKTTVAVVPKRRRRCAPRRCCIPKPQKKRKRRRKRKPRKCDIRIGTISDSDEVPCKLRKRCRKRVYCDDSTDCFDVVKVPKKRRRKQCRATRKIKACCSAAKLADKKAAVKERCTCTKEIRSAKNRVKLKSRYVRRGGKIYREEEFI